MRVSALRRRTLIKTLALGTVLGGLPRALPAAAPGDAPAAHIAALIPGAHLLGWGRFHYFMFHVYDAQLWVGPAGFRSDAPTATPFALDLEYARHFTGLAIAKTTLNEFERLDAGTPALRAQWNETLIKLLPDVEAGQHLTGFFLPSAGLRLYSNGTAVGGVADVELARWFFAIWLDPRTRAPELRTALLGGPPG